jgi:hypothetical protein
VTRPRVGILMALVGAAFIGAVVTVSIRGNTSPPAVRSVSLTTARVIRTSLATSVLTGGTLGYAPAGPVVNHLNGTYTLVPSFGTTIAAGQTLFRVDNQPVVLMTGTTPAWRAFSVGMTSGPDVVELETNLIALGDAGGLFSSSSARFTSLTAEAVRRWQVTEGVPPTGQLGLGEVVFLPSTLLVGAHSVSPGQSAAPGDIPFQVSTTSRSVTVPLNPDLPAVHIGQDTSITLPDGTTTPGVVTAIGPIQPSSGSSSSSPNESGTGLTVTPDHPAATGTGSSVGVEVSLRTQSVPDALNVPVSALLALAEGGYGLEVVEPSGTHRVVSVTTGIFANGRVQVNGPDIAAGTRIVVAQ